MTAIAPELSKFRDHPNYSLLDWLLDIASDVTHQEAHRVRAATVIIECEECGGIHLRGFREDNEGDPQPLLAQAVVLCARQSAESRRVQ